LGIDKPTSASLSSFQQFALVTLRSLIGWHFLYEGYFKFIVPAWAPDGTRLGRWSSEGYLAASTGSVGHFLHRLYAEGWGHWIDLIVIAALLAIGLSLILGAFTQLGCGGALAMLAIFYLTMLPLDGVHHLGQEGNYLVVDKNLIEFAAVLLLSSFKTGRIAGLDSLLSEWRKQRCLSQTAHGGETNVAG
jgi:thiosulfate dehydrogenase [quinone] large subunit